MIDSAQNAKLKHVRKLIASKKYRDESRQFVLESPKAIAEIPSHRIVFILKRADMPNHPALDSLSVPVFEIDHLLYEPLADTMTSQGWIAVIQQADVSLDLMSEGVLLVLDGLQDPGNVGTLIRTAVAFGCIGVVALKNTVDLYAPKVIRASAGASVYIPLMNFADLSEVRAHGFSITVCDAHHGIDYQHWQPPKKIALVMGQEGQGLRCDLKSIAHHQIRIPQTPHIDSLNVAIAGGIILSHLFQRDRSE